MRAFQMQLTLTEAERDALIDVLTSSAMGYEQATRETEQSFGWTEEDLSKFCAENYISVCEMCGWYNEESEMEEHHSGLICIECMEEGPDNE